MTKSTITREQLEEWVAQFDEDGGCDATDRQLEALIRQSLAAMESEPAAPVAEVVSIYGDPEAFGEREIRPLVGIQQMPYGTKLYRHAQMVPEYPEVLPCSVLLEPGLRFGKGIKTSTMLAALSRRSVYESDLAALSPEERVEFQAGIEDVKALIAQPAPVAQCPYPCGWDTLNKLAIQDAAFVSLALVAGGPATESIRQAAITNSDRLLKVISACRAATLAAAPQSPGSEPATVPGKWIPVSERVPESNGVYFGWDGKRVLEVNCFFGGFSANQFIHGEITHWMPLPAPPTEGK